MWPFGKNDSDPGLALAGSIIAALPDPALAIDGSGVVIFANDLAREVLDTDPRGLHISANVRAPAMLEAVTAVLNGESVQAVDYEMRFPVPRSLHAHVAALQPPSPRGAVIVLRDLTREQQIERMRADFVANASHELRTPLASLSGFIETIQGAAKNDEKAQARFLGLMRSRPTA